MNKLVVLLSMLLISTAFADEPSGSAYLDGGNNENALILAHGRGHGPTWLVVNPLRKGVHEQLGYHTLSIQLPSDPDQHWKDYAADFPQAYEDFDEAVRFLKNEKKVKNIYLMGHSMGSRMAAAYMVYKNNPAINGLIIIGCRNTGGDPLDCMDNIETVKVPILDLWGDSSYKDVKAAAERDFLVSDTYTQVAIDGGAHTLDGDEDEMIAAVVKWLKKVSQK